MVWQSSGVTGCYCLALPIAGHPPPSTSQVDRSAVQKNAWKSVRMTRVDLQELSRADPGYSVDGGLWEIPAWDATSMVTFP